MSSNQALENEIRVFDDPTVSYRVVDPVQATRIDDTTTANVTYIGKAPVGSLESAGVWQIAKLDETSGLVKTWADGNGNYDNIWNNRSSLTYS